MLVLKTETENVKWLGMANKYIENQWKPVKNWNGYELEKKFSDDGFEKELDFICSSISIL